jgi:hypothetical protein
MARVGSRYPGARRCWRVWVLPWARAILTMTVKNDASWSFRALTARNMARAMPLSV